MESLNDLDTAILEVLNDLDGRGVTADQIVQALRSLARPFDIGDRVRMPGVPFTVEVLEFGECDEDPCNMGGTTFRFKDPQTGEDDWMHAADFERA